MAVAVTMVVVVIMVATRHVTVGILMTAIMAVRMAVLVSMRMCVIVAAAAMILFAQTANVLGSLPALGHLIHHIGLHAIAANGEHRATQERVHASIPAQRADGGWCGTAPGTPRRQT